jgi:hypothetical protein
MPTRRSTTLLSIFAWTAAFGTASDLPQATSFTTLPEATASFGAVACDGWLYVYGGHIAKTHVYYDKAVSGGFHRLRLTGKSSWESLPGGVPLQGMNLAAHRGKIYLAGGMAPRNQEGAPADNHSTDRGSRFNPAGRTWEDLPPLPEARSSHDIVVLGDLLIVAGGWAMGGGSNKWMDTIAVMDLSSEKPQWKTEPQPFQRRALIAAAFQGKMYVIGGMNSRNSVERKVSIYDPAAKTWNDGPELPGNWMTGFAPAAVVHDGRLYVSVADGALLRLSRSGDSWEPAGSASPRVAHRLVSSGDAILVIGGAAKSHNLDLVEAVEAGK